MTIARLFGPALVLCGLTGCVAPYPVAPPQVPYVALPGPTKTEAQFRQDDTACRAAAVQLPQEPAGAAPSTRPIAGAGASGPIGQAVAQPSLPPGASYLRCMAVRGNPIEPLADTRPPVYAYYQPYPLFVGYGGYSPWLYGGYYGGFYGFGFYHGFGGYGGYRGYGGYGGFHGGGRR